MGRFYINISGSMTGGWERGFGANINNSSTPVKFGFMVMGNLFLMLMLDFIQIRGKMGQQYIYYINRLSSKQEYNWIK